MNRTCAECGDPVAGRVDKKFCCDQCRNSYNNRLNSDTHALVRNTNTILRKNRRILEELNPNGKARIHRDKLSMRGFNFTYHTQIHVTRTGRTYYYCYEYGYYLQDSGYVDIVRNAHVNA